MHERHWYFLRCMISEKEKKIVISQKLTLIHTEQW